MATKKELEDELERYKIACAHMSNEIEQAIANLFPEEFPLFPEDWGTDQRCIGDHSPETMVYTLIDRYLKLKNELESFKRIYYRPLPADGGGFPVVEWWYDVARYKEPAKTVGKEIYVKT